MNTYIKPSLVVRILDPKDRVLTESSVASPTDPTYAAQNLNNYMLGAAGAGRTTTTKIQNIMSFSK